MNIKEAKTILRKAVEENRTDLKFFLYGAPGVGKTQIITELANEFNLQLKVIRLAQVESIDLRGFPKIENKTTVWNPPVFLPIEGRDTGRGILFLDEFNRAPDDVQNAAMQVLDRYIGEYRISKDWFVWAAGNPAEGAFKVKALDPAVISRFIKLEIQPNVQVFLEYCKERGLNPLIQGFLNWRPDLLYQPPTRKDESFPCPRTWEYCSKILQIYLEEPSLSSLLTGALGDAVGMEFYGFIQIKNKLPDINEILKGKIKLETLDTGVLWFIASYVVGKVSENPKKNHQLLKLVHIELASNDTKLREIGVATLAMLPEDPEIISLPEITAIFENPEFEYLRDILSK